MNRYKIFATTVLVLTGAVALSGCEKMGSAQADTPRVSLFVGVDISGSFMNGPHFEDSIEFLAHYLYGHLHGTGGLERPNALFVSSIGGARADEPKTFYPIQSFENKSIDEITETLREMFPKDNPNPFTDYNAFFEQIAYTVRSKNLVLQHILNRILPRILGTWEFRFTAFTREVRIEVESRSRRRRFLSRSVRRDLLRV